ncbi:hypothetical protein VTJ04DRAFT_6841 [Mycothermus thermophilus]|uniref:uncharacterized protein n=1 Tax=Humicola insolens TaxID=85995 RepID=UPI0037432C4C
MSLEILFHYPKGRSEVNVILIPGIGTPRGQEWSLPARWSEGGLFNTLEHGVAFFAYDYAMRFDSHLTWDLILLEGQRLLQALDHMFPSSPGPILFICHGLGGIVLKQAICFASTCGHSYQNVRDCLSGIIFLGTPHYLDGASPGEFGERLVTLLKLAGLSLSPNARTLETLKATSEVIANLSKRFEQVCIRVNVLSVYERIQSKVREPGSLLKHSTKKVVVDRDLCSLGIVLERVVGLLVNHLELVSLSDPDGQLNEPVRPCEHDQSLQLFYYFGHTVDPPQQCTTMAVNGP